MVSWLRRHRHAVGRIAAIFVSLLVLAHGVRALLLGEPDYRNYWGGAVGSTSAAVVGILGLAVALFARTKPDGPPAKYRPRRGAKQEPASPLDDFEKW